MRASIPVVLAVGLLLTSCSSDDGQFVSGDATAEVTCMEHQPDSPGTTYTGGTDADTAAILAVFRYYVSHGDKGYCDGEPPTEEDLAWARLVVDLGGSADSVQPILDAG